MLFIDAQMFNVNMCMMALHARLRAQTNTLTNARKHVIIRIDSSKYLQPISSAT